MQFGDEGNHEMIEASHHGLGGYRETIETVVTQVRHQVTEEMVKTLSDRFGNGHVDQLNMQLIIQFRNKQNESMLDFLVNHYGSDERRKTCRTRLSRSSFHCPYLLPRCSTIQMLLKRCFTIQRSSREYCRTQEWRDG